METTTRTLGAKHHQAEEQTHMKKNKSTKATNPPFKDSKVLGAESSVMGTLIMN